MALDRARPYGESIGRGSNHKYIQDGKHFDVNGDEVTQDGQPVVKSAKVAAPAKVAAKVAEPEPLNEQAAAQLKA